jgi:tryptophan synthase alpha chain
MSRIASTFSALSASGKKALVPFLTAGFPHFDSTVPLMHALAGAGADLIELGVPFSDPMADGPTIQRSSEAALANGMTLKKLLGQVAEFRQTDAKTPVVLMGYANPIEAMGQAAFVAAAKAAGVDGVLTVDCPPEESGEFAGLLAQAGLDAIYLIAPTTTPSRIAYIGQHATGYVYYVSVKGVTGAAHLDFAEIDRRIPEIRKAAGLPVGVGFGIRDAETAAKMAAVADAVIVGSRFIEELEAAPKGEEALRIAALARELRAGIDKA